MLSKCPTGIFRSLRYNVKASGKTISSPQQYHCVVKLVPKRRIFRIRFLVSPFRELLGTTGNAPGHDTIHNMHIDADHMHIRQAVY